jgi:hypothetical protein
MDVFSYVVGALVLVPVLLRQMRVVPVPRAFVPRLPLILGVVGLFALSSYAGDHHVTAGGWDWVLGTLVGAVALGALRGLSTRVWDANGWVVRQGNAVTMALWLASLVLQFAGDAAAGIVGASFLIFLGLTMATQRYVEFRRARPAWDRLGPEAGRPFIMNFTQGPGAFFATFRTDAPGGPGAPGGGGPAGWGGSSAAYDPNVIDVDVVEDDEEHGPPELHAPR